MSEGLDRTRADLEAWLRASLDRPDLRVGELAALGAGFSNVTMTFEATWTDAGGVRTQDYVLRMPPSVVAFFEDTDVRLQYDWMRALAGTGVPVPVCVAATDDAVAGSPAFVMERIEGVVPSDGPPDGIHGAGLFFDATPAKRGELWSASLSAVAAVHAVDLAAVDLPVAKPGSVREAVGAELDRVERWLRYGSKDEIAVIEAGLRSARAAVPDDGEVVVCWGDPKVGNMVYRDGRVVGVLDWEMAAVLPPESDLMYWIVTDEASAVTFGRERLAGCPGRDETLRLYREISGRELRNLDYFELFQTLRLAVLLVLAERAMTQAGMAAHFPENWSRNNPSYFRLAELLGIAP